ncbi:MAG: hypothetical protein ACK40X_10070 [Armatimonadota bacterium]
MSRFVWEGEHLVSRFFSPTDEGRRILPSNLKCKLPLASAFSATLVGAIILVIIALALAIWSGIRSFGPQGREVGKLPGTFPTKEVEMHGGAPPPPAPQSGQMR